MVSGSKSVQNTPQGRIGGDSAQKEPSKKAASKSPNLLKLLLKHNPIDPLVDWSRNALKTLGVLDLFDDFVYWNVGRANFIRIFRKYWTYNITGKENFPEYGGALVIANHQSELDPFLVGSAVHRKVAWLSKAENFEIPIFKSVIKPFGTIPLKRGQSDDAALQKVRDVLESGGCVGMFPEGTRSPDGRLAEFRSGAARLCLEAGVPYVPCAIFGAYKVFPKHVDISKINLKSGQEISITIGQPVYIDPSMECTYENAQIIKEAMYHDIILLRAGKMNKSRVIRGPDDISPLTHVDEVAKIVQDPQKITASHRIQQVFDPARDLSIS